MALYKLPHYLLSCLLILLSIGISSPVYATNSTSEQQPTFEWELKRDKDDIQIFTRKIAGSKFKQVKGIMTIPSRLSSLVALVKDNEACPEWAEMCKVSKIHEQKSDTNMLIYVLNDIPWPVTDRDVLAQVNWSQNSDSLAVKMTSIATSGILPENKSIVRLVDATSSWEFIPKDNGMIQIINQAHIDPNGPTPAWVTNMMLIDAPFKTMQNMRKVIASGKYDDARESFVAEPAN